MLVSGHLESPFKADVLRGRGWHLRGLGQTTWMLRPYSYAQAIRPNLYNVAYGRTGSYKGMGAACDVLTDPTCGISSLQQTELMQTVPDATLPSSAIVSTPVSPWVWIGAGVLLLVMVARR